MSPPTDADQVRVADADPAVKLLNRGGPTQMGSDRAPRYTRGREGVIDHGHGVHVFADENAKGNRVGEHLYSVRFQARELWGPQASAKDVVHVDLWEPHLEAV